MSEITTVGLDLVKNVFQVHGADASGRTELRKKLRRDQVLAFFSQLQPCIVAMEAAAGIEQDQPCVRGFLRSAATKRGPNYHEAELIADCDRQDSVRDFALCNQRELTQIRGLADNLFEILLSHTQAVEQSAVEREHGAWLEALNKDCNVPETVGELAEVEVASVVERCFADQLYKRISVLERQLGDAVAP